MNNNGCSSDKICILSVHWLHSGARFAALIFLINALALTWLLLFDLIPRETLAWIASAIFWFLALVLGMVRWPPN